MYVVQCTFATTRPDNEIERFTWFSPAVGTRHIDNYFEMAKNESCLRKTIYVFADLSFAMYVFRFEFEMQWRRLVAGHRTYTVPAQDFAVPWTK